MSKTVLITGITSGIGLETARLLHKVGYRVIGLGRRAERLKKIREEFGKDSQFFNVDVNNSKQVSNLFKKIKHTRIDVLINNAGLALGTTRFQVSDPKDTEIMIQTNVVSLMKFTRLILDQFIKRSNGHIINIGSVAGKWAYTGGSVYCATKAAVRMFSEALRMDLKGHNIRVTNLEPGMVETEFSIIRLRSKKKAALVYEGMSPLRATDIAESILWCINRPQHVNISELTIFPTDQAGVGAHLVHRR